VKGNTLKPYTRKVEQRESQVQNHPRVTCRGHADADGQEVVETWDCVDGCPVKALGDQSGKSRSSSRPRPRGGASGFLEKLPDPQGEEYHDDQGTAARFFPQFPGPPFMYCPKASRSERRLGLDGEQAKHPTMKPRALMDWLVSLVARPGSVILDPFMGSGTTIMACAGRCSAIGIEQDPVYMDWARRRVLHAWAGGGGAGDDPGEGGGGTSVGVWRGQTMARRL